AIYNVVLGATPRGGNPLLWSVAAESHQLSAELVDVPRCSRFGNMRSNRPDPAASEWRPCASRKKANLDIPRSALGSHLESFNVSVLTFDGAAANLMGGAVEQLRAALDVFSASSPVK
ncbi:unnamed protein product, partial [Prorocentrum cordatum]